MSNTYWHKYNLVNGNSSWIPDPTIKNMTKILKYLLKNHNVESKKKEVYSFEKLSKTLKIDRRSVGHCCKLMALKEKKPFIKIHARKYKNKGKVQVTTLVELISIPKKKEN